MPQTYDAEDRRIELEQALATARDDLKAEVAAHKSAVRMLAAMVIASGGRFVVPTSVIVKMPDNVRIHREDMVEGIVFSTPNVSGQGIANPGATLAPQEACRG